MSSEPEELRQDLELTASADIEVLLKKEREYGSSWKKRGGVGAFMMLARKWDRIETNCSNWQWDIFNAYDNDSRAEGILDDIADLRRYLMLVQVELIERKVRDVNAAGLRPKHS
jgi:hypothetical protein